MRREILFEMSPLPRQKAVIDLSEPADTGSYFNNMDPIPNPPHYNRPKGESPASRARRINSKASKNAP